jgi:hypothetical protein
MASLVRAPYHAVCEAHLPCQHATSSRRPPETELSSHPDCFSPNHIATFYPGFYVSFYYEGIALRSIPCRVYAFGHGSECGSKGQSRISEINSGKGDSYDITLPTNPRGGQRPPGRINRSSMDFTMASIRLELSGSSASRTKEAMPPARQEKRQPPAWTWWRWRRRHADEVANGLLGPVFTQRILREVPGPWRTSWVCR